MLRLAVKGSGVQIPLPPLRCRIDNVFLGQRSIFDRYPLRRLDQVGNVSSVHDGHPDADELVDSLVVQARDRISCQDDSEVTLAGLIDRCSGAVREVAAREDQRADAVALEMPFEGCLKEGPPSRLEDDYLVGSEGLDAPGQKKVLIKFGWNIAEDLGGDESPACPGRRMGVSPLTRLDRDGSALLPSAR